MVYELRTVIKQDMFDNVVKYFDEVANKTDIENQIIYNYHTEGDFRLIRTNKYVQLDLKTNKGENIVYINKKYDKDLISMFKNIGISVDFKRFRNRYKYLLDDIYVTIDKNLKTGNILRAKFNYETDEEKQAKIEKIHQIYNTLNIIETPLDKFEEMYGKYRHGWYELVKDIDEDEFLK